MYTCVDSGRPTRNIRGSWGRDDDGKHEKKKNVPKKNVGKMSVSPSTPASVSFFSSRCASHPCMGWAGPQRSGVSIFAGSLFAIFKLQIRSNFKTRWSLETHQCRVHAPTSATRPRDRAGTEQRCLIHMAVRIRDRRGLRGAKDRGIRTVGQYDW